MASRIRERYNNGPNYTYGRIYKDYDSGSETTVLEYSDILESSDWEYIDDTVTKEFPEKQSAGEVVVNPVTHVKESIKTVGSGGLLRYRKTPTTNYVSVWDCDALTELGYRVAPGRFQSYPTDPLPSHDLTSSARLQALGNLDRSPYAFAEDIAELRQTFKFLKDPLKSLRQLSKEFKQDVSSLLSRKKNLSKIDAISDVYLQFRFAFSPLVRSANDFIEAFGDNIRRPKRRTARGREDFSHPPVINRGTISDWDTYSSVEIVERVDRAGILYEVSNPLGDWRYKYGLRFKDIPETLWAIFPYSFMVDRIFNLSEATRGFVSFLDPNVKILGAWDSSKETKRYERSWLNYTNSNAVILTMRSDVKQREVVTYTRTPWEPSIDDLIPPVEVEGLVDTSTKIADLFALVWQRMR